MKGCERLRRFLVLLLVISGILSGCSNDEISFSEVNIDKVKEDVKDFIRGIEASESEKGTGIYMFNESDKVRYLYLDKDFLDNEKGFGDLDIKVDDNSLNIYLTDSLDAAVSEEEYKLYKIKLKSNEEYEYMKVFKNGEETNLQLIGLKDID